MKWNELYNQVNTKKYSIITGINQNIKLNSKLANFYKNNKILFFSLIIIIIGLTLFAYRLNILKIAITLVALVLIFVFIILKYTYSLKGTENSLKVNLFSDEIEIPYDRLLNIFMYKTKNDFLFFVPSYKIGIIFKQEDDEQVILTLSTAMTNKEDVLKMFQCIETEVIESQQKEEDKIATSKVQKRKALLITAGVSVVIALLTGLIVYIVEALHSW